MPTAKDVAAHKIAVLAFGGEIDGRRRAALQAQYLVQPERLPEMALRLADQHQRVPVRRGDADGQSAIIEHAERADSGGGQNAGALGLVVKAHIAAHDREIECQTGGRHAFDAGHELAP